MMVEEVQKRKDEFVKGVAVIDEKIKSYTAEISRLADAKKVTLGAISDCEYWIAQLSKNDESEVYDESETE